MKYKTYEYERGYKTSQGWANYIPPKFKKKLIEKCKKLNKGKRKDSDTYVHWWDFIEIGPYRTKIFI